MYIDKGEWQKALDTAEQQVKFFQVVLDATRNAYYLLMNAHIFK